MDNDINLNIDYTDDLILKFHNNLDDKNSIDININKLIKNQEDLIKYINELSFLEKLYTINEIIKINENDKPLFPNVKKFPVIKVKPIKRLNKSKNTPSRTIRMGGVIHNTNMYQNHLIVEGYLDEHDRWIETLVEPGPGF